MTTKIVEINADQFQSEVLDKACAVVDFYSTECPPCEALASKYDALSELYGDDVHFVKIFRQGNRELATSLDVSSSPSVLFFQNGKQVGKTMSGGIKRSAMMQELDGLVGADKAKAIHERVKPVLTETDVLILGGGPAGLTAGIYLGQAQLKTIIVDTALPGGYVGTSHLVSNYPGFVEPVEGFMLAHFFSEQAKANGVEFRSPVELSEVDLDKKTVLVDGYEVIQAKRMILATGSRPRPLNVPGEMEFRGQGISYCSTCDAKYFQDKEVVVIGGGNSAIEESLFIARFAKKLTIVHQFDTLQANQIAQSKAFADKKIEILFSHEPREFKKYGNMDMGVVVEDLKTRKSREIRTNGIFVFVGFIPNVDSFAGKLTLDQWGYVDASPTMETNIKGVYAVGDLKSKHYRQITTAVSDGTVAAITITKELEN